MFSHTHKIQVLSQNNELIYSLYLLLLLLLYPNGESISSIAIYAIIFVSSFKFNMLPIVFLGCGNYLPRIFGVSPLVIGFLIMIVIIIINSFLKTGLKFPITQFKWSYFVIMTLWCFITGFIYNDLNFFTNFLTALVYCIGVAFYQKTMNISADNIFKYFIFGMTTGVFIALLIQLGIPGYEGYYKGYDQFRLAIGERSDPNSSGLMFAILSVFLFLKTGECFTKSTLKSIFFSALFMLSLYCLISTQSRGSFLSFVIVLSFFIFSKKMNGKYLINIFKFLLFIMIILAVSPQLQEVILELWQSFYSRWIISEAGDGERLYLLEKSFQSFFMHPIFGESLETFKIQFGHFPHNCFSDYMVTNGIIGIIFFFVFFIKPLFAIYDFRNIECLKKQYYCYLVCIINILFYSASNEKITFFLLLILLFSFMEYAKNKV